MKKKSFFERMGLVERVGEPPSEAPAYYESYPEVDPEPAVEANTAETVADTLIADIYANNDLSDMSRSIFKAEEVSNSLPSTMPTDTKRTAVIGILASFQLTPEELLEDAENRKQIITSAANSMMANRVQAIANTKEVIEDLRKQIESCEATIKNHEQEHAFISQASEAEIKRIDALASFLSDDTTS